MSMAMSTISSPKLWRHYAHPPLRTTTPIAITPLRSSTSVQTLKFHSSLSTNLQPKRFWVSRAMPRTCVRAESGGGGDGAERKVSGGELEDKEVEDLRENSTMPDRFKYLTQEPPSPPLRWPWFVALAFLIYAWRSVLWELSNWRKAIVSMLQFVGYLSKLVLALIYHFIGDPITSSVLYIETAVDAVRSFYFSIVTSAPIPELTTIVILASTVLAIGEAASPNSINCQPYILTIAGIIGYAAVRGFIIEPFFWLLLFGLFCFSRLFKKRDYVCSALPIVAVLASVGEPWIRALAIASFTALAIHHHSKQLVDGKKDAEVVAPSNRKVPFPLLGVALAIGIRVVAKWAGYRHLTWMIV